MIRVMRLGDTPRSEILARDERLSAVAETVAGIIENVKANGDAAVLEYSEQFDGGAPEALEVSRQDMAQARREVDPAFVEVLERSAANIRAFHEAQVRHGFMLSRPDGSLVGQKIVPIEYAAIYVPGGTAAYPSTVLMDAIPAKIAGCSHVIMVTPAKNGHIRPELLVAAQIAGVDRIFRMGGAQAIAALAYGTESVPRVDKIAGPGNAYVAEAKRQVFGRVAIDMIAGPSEILVIADKNTDPAVAAADLLSQAEHDTMASAVLLTDSEGLATSVAEQIEVQLKELPRADIARESIDRNGKIIVCASLGEAVALANELAPEHLELCVDHPFDLLGSIRNAGSVFLGRDCPEAMGDYYAGPNHTLPTGGTARFSSPLSVDDFVKKIQFTYYSEDAFAAAEPDVARFAHEEGLDAHARSVEIRTEKAKGRQQ